MALGERYRLGARFARASCGVRWALPSRRSLRSRLVWRKVGATVSALAALAHRVALGGRYRLGARCARASCGVRWALLITKALHH